LGVQNEPFLPAKQWQTQVSYQYADANDFYVGDQRNDAAAPSGVPPVRTVSLMNLDVIYALSNRLSLDLTIPFAVGSAEVMQGPANSRTVHHFSASGLGDVSLQAEYWLSNPEKPSRSSGSVGLGIKAPTGSDDVEGTVGTPAGDVRAPIDEAAQLGTGGWQLLLRAQGTTTITGPLFGYASGYYGLSLTEHTDVVNGAVGALRGDPDTYSGRLGLAYLLPFLRANGQGLVVSLGGRINGVTVKDLIGGEDLYWRRPGYVNYVEPGLTWTLGSNMASVSVPLRVNANKLDSPLDVSLNRHIGASFASYLFLASYAHRF
jgi:hypothetical protein